MYACTPQAAPATSHGEFGDQSWRKPCSKFFATLPACSHTCCPYDNNLLNETLLHIILHMHRHIVVPQPSALPLLPLSCAGLRVSFQRAALLQQFPDAFRPFLLFGCTLREPFAGTLFRFPLRTAAAAAVSEIKPGRVCSPGDALGLLRAFQVGIRVLWGASPSLQRSSSSEPVQDDSILHKSQIEVFLRDPQHWRT